MNPERLRAFLADIDRWMRESDVVRRKTLLREVYQEIRGSKPWTRPVLVTANLETLTRAFVVSPTGHLKSPHGGPSRISGRGAGPPWTQGHAQCQTILAPRRV